MYTEVNIYRAKRVKRILPREKNSQRLPRIFISLLVRASNAPPCVSRGYRYAPHKKKKKRYGQYAHHGTTAMQSAEEGTRSRSPLASERSSRAISRRYRESAFQRPDALTRRFKPQPRLNRTSGRGRVCESLRCSLVIR